MKRPRPTSSKSSSGKTAVEEWLNAFVRDRKAEYNKFYYQLGRGDPNLKVTWREMQKTDDVDGAEAFINTISQGSRKTKRSLTITNERCATTSGKWKMFSEAS